MKEENNNILSQDRLSREDMKLVDVEKFLLKVTSKRLISTPTVGHNFPYPDQSHIPPQILQKST